MKPRERMLYQQIHPAKLLTDFGTSFASAWLLWEARYGAALVVGFLPSIAVSVWLVQFSDLERLRQSWFGRYLTLHMQTRIVLARIAGQLLVWGGALVHVPWLLPFGYFVVILAWMNGLWMPSSQALATAECSSLNTRACPGQEDANASGLTIEL